MSEPHLPTPSSPAPSRPQQSHTAPDPDAGLWQDPAALPPLGAAAKSAASAQPWERQAIERLLFASINEQRSARRWRIFWRFVWVALIAGFIWAMGQHSGPSVVAAEHTAVVDITGPIADDAPASAANVSAAMQAALQAPNARALVLRINSPGGSPVQAGMIYDEIRRLRQLHDKPIYAVVEEMCASAAYYIAAATDEIYVNRASVVGSIGVLIDSFGFTGTMEKLGVERRLMTAGHNKAMLDPFSPQDETHRAHLQNMLNELHQQFIDAVQSGRGQRLKVHEDTFSGLVWTGQSAIEQGLADKIGSVGSVARDVVGAADTIDYTQHENVADRLARQLGMAAGTGAVQSLRLAWPQWR